MGNYQYWVIIFIKFPDQINQPFMFLQVFGISFPDLIQAGDKFKGII